MAMLGCLSGGTSFDLAGLACFFLPALSFRLSPEPPRFKRTILASPSVSAEGATLHLSFSLSHTSPGGWTSFRRSSVFLGGLPGILLGKMSASLPPSLPAFFLSAAENVQPFFHLPAFLRVVFTAALFDFY